MAGRTIAYLTPLYFDEGSYLGGGERYPLNLARGVVHASGGIDRVRLISFGNERLERPMAPGVTLRVVPITGKPSNPLDVVSWDMPDAIADADLVHIHQAYTRTAELGILLARQQGKPIVVTDHGGFTSPLGLEVGSLELVDRIVAQSEFVAGRFKTNTPITIIKGGVDADLFQPPVDLRRKRDTVLFVGRLLPHKGIDRLIEAVPADLPLTICGRPYHDEYHALLRRLAEPKRVTFVTDADDATIRSLYARAWATVLPSVYCDCYGTVYREPELMGLTLLESMACGTPAIASRVTAMPEFVHHGVTGFVFDTVEELNSQLVRLASSPELVNRMGRSARESVEREFDLKVAGARLRDIYEALWNSGREAAA